MPTASGSATHREELSEVSRDGARETSDRSGYPLLLDVSGRRTVVVGGGPVAARRTRGLLDAGAQVTVIAPRICADLDELAARGRFTWSEREYAAGDLDGAWLVHTATGERSTDARVAADADAAHLWCVRADDAAASAAWTPAVARVDDLTVAVSAGGDPGRARTVKDAVATGLATGDLPTRRHRRARRGHVTLVGGGPGDPDLITVRGRRLVADADVVVVDRLAPRTLLDALHPDVEIVQAGKGPNAHTMSQEEINDVLVERARAGDQVVRLKGGDPFVLGRGGEEALVCAEAGVACTVVPGVTSAVAVPAAAGIPLTHRGASREFTVVSGHWAREGEHPDWATLAGLSGTLVILMGVAHLAETASALQSYGRAPDTPVAVVERGTTPDQRTTTGTLATIGESAARRGVRSPAVIVVGAVVEIAQRLAALVAE